MDSFKSFNNNNSVYLNANKSNISSFKSVNVNKNDTYLQSSCFSSSSNASSYVALNHENSSFPSSLSRLPPPHTAAAAHKTPTQVSQILNLAKNLESNNNVYEDVKFDNLPLNHLKKSMRGEMHYNQQQNLLKTNELKHADHAAFNGSSKTLDAAKNREEDNYDTKVLRKPSTFMSNNKPTENVSKTNSEKIAIKQQPRMDPSSTPLPLSSSLSNFGKSEEKTTLEKNNSRCKNEALVKRSSSKSSTTSYTSSSSDNEERSCSSSSSSDENAPLASRNVQNIMNMSKVVDRKEPLIKKEENSSVKNCLSRSKKKVQEDSVLKTKKRKVEKDDNYKAKSKKSSSMLISEEEEEESKVLMGSFSPTQRSFKAKIVAKLLCRWWYAYPDWPPKDFDYKLELHKRKLKWINLEDWEAMEDEDENGFTKVYQISAFPGVFRDPTGKAIDLRPRSSCPCYANFMKKSEIYLLENLCKAYREQIHMLRLSPYDEESLKKKLTLELEEMNKELLKHQRRADFLKKKAES